MSTECWFCRLKGHAQKQCKKYLADRERRIRIRNYHSFLKVEQLKIYKSQIRRSVMKKCLQSSDKRVKRSLMGRSSKFEILGLLKENKQVPSMTATRILRWVIMLAAYKYTIIFKTGENHGNADGLSRLPREVTVSN